MAIQEPDLYILLNRCPQCGEQLHAAHGFKVRWIRVKKMWFVSCDSINCDYVYPKQFETMEELVKKFEIQV
ncbi:MAG TPA: hypothetical protein VKI61_20330 [Chitinophagaceae bacterium]|nr:hypothetical protein [Chitinophagaceae bacterium]